MPRSLRYSNANSTLQTVRKGNTATNRQYFHNLWDVAKTLLTMQIEKQALKSRFIAYKDVSQPFLKKCTQGLTDCVQVEPRLGMRLERVKRLMLDLALTLKVHPIALGIKAEASGQVSVPKNVRIEATCITNVFHYNDRAKRPDREYMNVARLGAGIHVIPEPVLDLKVVITAQTPGRIDAVVVVEHRNLSDVLLKESFAVENVLIIMTAGFPDSGTKEFLHMLSTNPRTKAIPFLYFGDHDTPGCKIFQCLKYGSKVSAWATPISVCTQLRYVGPTRADLENSTALFRPHWETQYRVNHPHATSLQVTKAANDWQKNTERKLIGKFTALTKKDKEILTSFKKIGWLKHEELIRKEIAMMKKKPSVSTSRSRISSLSLTRCLQVFRFANLAQASRQYVRQFIEAKVQEHCSQRMTVLQPAASVVSPRTQRFRDLPSQFSNVERSGNTVSQTDVETNNQADIGEAMAPEAIFEEFAVEMY